MTWDQTWTDYPGYGAAATTAKPTAADLNNMVAEIKKGTVTRPPYDAIVYIDGTSIKAVSNIGTVISSGTTGTDDTTVIQAAIDVSATNYDILVRNGTYAITTPLLFHDKDHVTLRGEGPGTRLNVTGNTGCITVYGVTTRSQISDFGIFVPAGNTSNLLNLVVGTGERIRLSKFKNITFECAHSSSGWTGLNLETSSTGYICKNTFRDILIGTYCNKGLNFAAVGTVNATFINANIFDNIWVMWPASVGVDFTSTTASCDSNTFINVHIEPTTTTTDGFKNVGKVGNTFYGCFAWDWTVPTSPNYAISFAAGSSNNIFYGSRTSILTINNLGYPSNQVITGWDHILTTNRVRIVSQTGGDYPSLSAALAGITDASASNKYCILVTGSITETALITGKSYVDVFGLGADVDITSESDGNGVSLNNMASSVWKDITFRRSNSTNASNSVIKIYGTTDNTVQLLNINAINQISGAASCMGINIAYQSSPQLVNCYGKGAATSNDGYGIGIGDSAPTLISCRGEAGTGGTSRFGILVSTDLISNLINCIGTGTGGNPGIKFTTSYNPKSVVSGCISNGVPFVSSPGSISELRQTLSTLMGVLS